MQGFTGDELAGFVVSILKDGEYEKIVRGEFDVTGTRPDGSLIVGEIETGDVLAVPGSQWRISSHDATQYGSRLLAEFLPDRKFPFPKSLYAVEDVLRFFVNDKPNAVILDFFGGSGTTTHAVARLNRQDNGRRRSILVSNNEVANDEETALASQGLAPGSDEWEAHGIFESITRPRIKAALTGKLPDGMPVPGEYRFVDSFPMREGFAENAASFRLDFLDPAEVSRGDRFEAIVPILWMLAGCVGTCKTSRGSTPWFIPEKNPYAVLIDEHEFENFKKKLAERKGVPLTHIFLVTDSTESFAELADELGAEFHCVQLYKSYLDTFKINLTEPNGLREAGRAV